MKNFFKSIKFRLSDLFLALGFLPFAVILIFGQLFMQFQNPSDVALPLWAAILCFVVMVAAWSIYLYLEVFRKKENYNLWIAGACATLILLNIIVIACQPSRVVENVIVRYRLDHPELIGTVETAIIQVSPIHKFIFISEIVATIMFIYIGLFVLPRRFKTVIFLKYLGFALFIFLLVLMIYGYVVDYDKYVAFFKHIFLHDREDPDIYHKCVTSFIINRNAYGMCMMMGIIFSFINHSIHKKWFYFLFAGIFYFNMIFSLCKTGLVISAVLIVIYVTYRLIVTFKEHKKRNLAFIISFGSVVLIAGGILGLSIVTKGKVLGSIYNFYNDIVRGGKTLDNRSYIWDNTYQLLRNGNWLIGRGFGIINLLLQPMNMLSHEEKVFPTHSAYLSLIAEGGILFLVAYLALLVYSGIIIVRCYKKEPGLTVAMSLGAIAFVLYSFIETIHYLVYVFLFPIMILYYATKEKENEEKALQ